jgi:hypothetical protein
MFSPQAFFGDAFAAKALPRRVAPVPQPPSTLGIFSLRSFNAISFASRSLDHTYAGEGGGTTPPPVVVSEWVRVQRQAQNWQRAARGDGGWVRKPKPYQPWYNYHTGTQVIPVTGIGDIDGASTVTGVGFWYITGGSYSPMPWLISGKGSTLGASGMIGSFSPFPWWGGGEYATPTIDTIRETLPPWMAGGGYASST